MITTFNLMFDVEWMNKAEDYDDFFDFFIKPDFFFGEVSVETDEGGVKIVPFATSTWTNEYTMYIYMYINGNWEGFWIGIEYLPGRLQDCFDEDIQYYAECLPKDRKIRKTSYSRHGRSSKQQKEKKEQKRKLANRKEKEKLKSAIATMETDLTMEQAKNIATEIIAIKRWIAMERDAIWELQLKLQYQTLGFTQRREIEYMISDIEAYIEDEKEKLFYYENNIIPERR